MKALKEYSIATILAIGLTVSSRAQQDPAEPVEAAPAPVEAPAQQDAADAPAEAINRADQPVETTPRPQRSLRNESRQPDSTRPENAVADPGLTFVTRRSTSS